MERVVNGTLTAILRRELREYAGNIDTPSGESKLYYTENLDDQVFCLTVPHLSAELPAELLMMAHIADDQIIIDFDTTNKPLADALRQAGIPADQIIFAWQRN